MLKQDSCRFNIHSCGNAAAEAKKWECEVVGEGIHFYVQGPIPEIALSRATAKLNKLLIVLNEEES